MRRKTNEQFLREMETKHPTLTVLEEYTNNRTRVKVRCNVCGNEFSPVAASLYMGHGCPYCTKIVKRTTEQFKEEVAKLNKEITIIGEYKNLKTHIETKCNICGYTWNAHPRVLLRGSNCPKCSGRMRKTQEQFEKEMAEKHPTIRVIGKYINNATKVKCFCTKCGSYFYNRPHTMLDGGNGCNNCTKSRGENKILDWLKNTDIEFIQQFTFEHCKDERVLPFDFYLPKNNTIIEYDGKQHFEPNEYFGGIEGFNYTKRHDKIKNEYCENNNIRLIRIPYYEFDNIEKILEKELAS